MIKRALSTLFSVLHYVSGGGSWRLQTHERQLLGACADSLPEGIQSQIKKQLDAGFFIERTLGGRINVIHKNEKPESHRINDPEFDDALFKVRAEVDGKNLTANITFYKGFLFGLETKKPTKFFRNKPLIIRGVAKGKPKETYTAAIDRLEHGREV